MRFSLRGFRAARYLSNTAGNMGVIFALSVLPVLVASGSAIDYVRASRAQTQLQAAVDAAALAVATAMSTTNSTNAQLRTIGLNYFHDNLRDAALADLQPVFSIGKASLSGSVEYDYPTSFMALVGINSMHIGASAQVEGGKGSNAEVALVLDYSLSMVTNNKYIRMRDAVTKMIDDLDANAKSSDGGGTLKVGLAPFSAMVRTTMPASYVTQAAAGPTWTGCTQDRKNPWNVGVATPDGSNDSKWGFIDSGNGKENAAPRYDCAKYSTNKLDVVPLTDDLDGLKSAIAAMYPVGNTNIPLGFEFGWNLLDPAAPYTEGAPYTDADTKKFIVLLTDGAQTSGEFDVDGNRSKYIGNDNLKTLCKAAAAKNITIFTIAYDITDPAITTLLKACAPANYFEASVSGGEIDAVFTAITTRIKKSTLRISR
ncbi:vWA domain-containing protein [Aestuariivirga sp.]|uniref:vWA domain-containing protein n=1 Tax=Aestuariivirga sp. TaxID=2650926 RepID=UPI0039E48586